MCAWPSCARAPAEIAALQAPQVLVPECAHCAVVLWGVLCRHGCAQLPRWKQDEIMIEHLRRTNAALEQEAKEENDRHVVGARHGALPALHASPFPFPLPLPSRPPGGGCRRPPPPSQWSLFGCGCSSSARVLVAAACCCCVSLLPKHPPALRVGGACWLSCPLLLLLLLLLVCAADGGGPSGSAHCGAQVREGGPGGRRGPSRRPNQGSAERQDGAAERRERAQGAAGPTGHPKAAAAGTWQRSSACCAGRALNPPRVSVHPHIHTPLPPPFPAQQRANAAAWV